MLSAFRLVLYKRIKKLLSEFSRDKPFHISKDDKIIKVKISKDKKSFIILDSYAIFQINLLG